MADIFCMKNEHSYAAFMGVLSSFYVKAHASARCRTGEYMATLMIDDSMTKPFKEQPESSEERIHTLIARMPKPEKDIDLKVFRRNLINMPDDSKVGLKHTVSHSWPLEKMGDGTDVTVNYPPPQLSHGENKERFFTHKELDIEVHNVVDYYTPIHDLLSILDRTKTFVGYQGGIAWLAMSMGIPTYIIHPKTEPQKHHLKQRLFGQDLGQITYFDGKHLRNVRQHPHEHHVALRDFKG